MTVGASTRSATGRASTFTPGGARPGRDVLRRRAPRARRLGDRAQARGVRLREPRRQAVGRTRPEGSRRRLRLHGARSSRSTSCSPRRRSAASWRTAPIPVDFLSDNIRIQTNVLDAALANDVERVAVPRLVVHLPEVRRSSRSARTRCSPGTSSRRTTRTRSRRSPASCRPRRCGASTGCRGSRPCRRTSTGRTTTSHRRGRTCCRR